MQHIVTVLLYFDQRLESPIQVEDTLNVNHSVIHSSVHTSVELTQLLAVSNVPCS